jgi:hypothetical protein
MFSKIEKFVFLALVFSIPFQKRFFLFGPSPEGEGFFEWSSGFLYFTDILVIFLFTLWARNMTRNVSSPWLWPLIVFAGFAFISLTQADLVDVGVYRFIKLAEFIFIFFYVASRARIIGIKPILGAFVASGIFQSILAILQFAKQSSLGLEIFHESILEIGLKGVAEISVGGMEFIRAYGTFPSPNVLAGFLGICLLFLFGLYLRGGRGNTIPEPLATPARSLVQSSARSPAPQSGTGTMPARLRVFWNSITPTPLWMYGILIFLLSFGLVLTFSRGVIVFFVFTTILFFAGIFLLEKLKQYRKQASRLAVLVIVSWLFIVAAAWPEVSSRFLESSVGEPAIQERLFFNEVGLDTVRQNYPQLFFGVGIGNFVNHYMQSLPDLAPHLYQPVHNLFILIASEIGVLGLLVFVIFLVSLFKKSLQSFFRLSYPHDREQMMMIFSLFFIFHFLFFISLYDHYFWTLQQGGLMFWISLGLLAGGTRYYNKRR